MIRAFVCACTFALAIAAPAAAQPFAPADVWAEVLAYEHGLAEALNSRDRVMMDRLLSEDFVLRGSPDVDRETWIRNALTYCWGEQSDFSNVSVRLDNDIAIASLVVTFYVDPISCQPATLRSLITDVWLREGDTWQLRVRHSGPVPADSIIGQFGAVEEPPPTWSFNSEFSFVSTAGNATTRSIGLGSTLVHRSDQTRSEASFSYISAEAESTTQARALTAYVRHGIVVRESIDVFGRIGYARDRFAGIANRITTDAGAAFSTTFPRQVLTTELSIGYTSEERLAEADRRFATTTGAFLYEWRVRPEADLRNSLRVIADVTDARNWRGTNELSLNVILTRLLTLRVSHSFEYRNLPVENFRPTDQRTAAAFVFAWQRR